MVNFDNDVARHFFVQNIVYLAREFHIDGFRFDFTRPIHNPDDGNIRLRGSGGGWQFLREVREKVKAVDPKILLIAEELPNTWQVTAEDVGDAWAGDRHGPFDAQWADGVPRWLQAGADRRQSRRAARGVRRLRRQLAGCRRLRRITR